MPTAGSTTRMTGWAWAWCRRLPLVLVAALGVAVATAAQGQDGGRAGGQDEFGPENAVLVKGPTLGRELPFLGPNVVEYWRASYEYQNDIFIVYLTRDPVFGLGEWTQGQCGDREGRYQEGEEGGTEIWHLSADGINDDADWHLFVDVRDFDGDACQIMPPFIDRLQFFFDALGADSRETPLPAVVGPAL